MAELIPGLVREQDHVVTQADTAATWGSGGLDVLGTPSLVGLMEITAHQAVLPLLPEGQTTVGGRVDIRHLAATPVGMKVHIRAEMTAVERRKLTFKVQAWDEVELIGEADHVRFVIDIEKFMTRVSGKMAKG
jgi:fluoroacetyl-CoA thioesterase